LKIGTIQVWGVSNGVKCVEHIHVSYMVKGEFGVYCEQMHNESMKLFIPYSSIRMISEINEVK